MSFSASRRSSRAHSRPETARAGASNSSTLCAWLSHSRTTQSPRLAATTTACDTSANHCGYSAVEAGSCGMVSSWSERLRLRLRRRLPDVSLSEDDELPESPPGESPPRRERRRRPRVVLRRVSSWVTKSSPPSSSSSSGTVPWLFPSPPPPGGSEPSPGGRRPPAEMPGAGRPRLAPEPQKIPWPPASLDEVPEPPAPCVAAETPGGWVTVVVGDR